MTSAHRAHVVGGHRSHPGRAHTPGRPQVAGRRPPLPARHLGPGSGAGRWPEPVRSEGDPRAHSTGRSSPDRGQRTGTFPRSGPRWSRDGAFSGPRRTGPGGRSRAPDQGARWSGRRDSNPRPSPWQGVELGLCGTAHLLRCGSVHPVSTEPGSVTACCRPVYYLVMLTKISRNSRHLRMRKERRRLTWATLRREVPAFAQWCPVRQPLKTLGLEGRGGRPRRPSDGT